MDIRKRKELFGLDLFDIMNYVGIVDRNEEILKWVSLEVRMLNLFWDWIWDEKRRKEGRNWKMKEYLRKGEYLNFVFFIREVFISLKKKVDFKIFVMSNGIILYVFFWFFY